MTHRADLCAELQATWYRDIPLAAALAVAVEDYDGETVTVRAPLPPNRNLHGTAFAGSLFSVCALAGWGATWLCWREQGLTGLIVVAESAIRYRKAVTGDLLCHCTPDSDAVATALETFKATGRAQLPLTCTIDVDNQRAVNFTGTYVVHANRH